MLLRETNEAAAVLLANRLRELVAAAVVESGGHSAAYTTIALTGIADRRGRFAAQSPWDAARMRARAYIDTTDIEQPVVDIIVRRAVFRRFAEPSKIERRHGSEGKVTATDLVLDLSWCREELPETRVLRADEGSRS